MFKIGITAGMMLMTHIILLQVWKFISPSLFLVEWKYIGQLVFFATLFFAFGVLLCYFTSSRYHPIPGDIQNRALNSNHQARGLYRIYSQVHVRYGGVFELPLIMVMLGRIVIINSAILTKFRKYAFLIAFIVGAIVTPTPDVVNMTLMSLTIYLLYELGSLGVRLFGVKKKSDATEIIKA